MDTIIYLLFLECGDDMVTCSVTVICVAHANTCAQSPTKKLTTTILQQYFIGRIIIVIKTSIQAKIIYPDAAKPQNKSMMVMITIVENQQYRTFATLI